MVEVELIENKGIVIVRPTENVGLTVADFQQISDTIDNYLKDYDSLLGVIVVADKFPGWENLNAFISHLKNIRDHHNSIKKVAIVSNSPFLTAAPHLIDPLVKTKVKHFAFKDFEEAKEWMIKKEETSHGFIILEDYPEDVVAVRAEGIITSDDYEKTLIPLMEKIIKEKGQVKLLYWCGTEFEGFSVGAMWDDARYGLMHMGKFSKFALVTDVDWLRMSMTLFAPVIPVPVKVFHNAELDDAKEWVKAEKQ